MLSKGADIEARGANEQSPLCLAANQGTALMVQRLLKAGAKVDAVDRSGNTALMGAADVPTARLLLDAGAAVNARGTRQRTPLMTAVNSGEPRPDLVTLLIQRGADVNAVAEQGETALQAAIAHGTSHRAIVRILREAGAKK